MLALALDAFPPVAFDLGLYGWTPTLEFTGHIRRRPQPGWLRVVLSTDNVGGGLMEEDARIWDSAGNLVAQSRQLCECVRCPTRLLTSFPRDAVCRWAQSRSTVGSRRGPAAPVPLRGPDRAGVAGRQPGRLPRRGRHLRRPRRHRAGHPGLGWKSSMRSQPSSPVIPWSMHPPRRKARRAGLGPRRRAGARFSGIRRGLEPATRRLNS